MADNVKPRRRRWRVTLRAWGYAPTGEGAGIGRAYARAMAAAQGNGVAKIGFVTEAK